MTVRVDRLVTDVSLSREPPAAETALTGSPEAPPPAGPGAGREDPRWDRDQQWRQNRQRLQGLELRTRAEGFDD